MNTNGSDRYGRIFKCLNSWLLVFATLISPVVTWAALPEARVETEYQALKYQVDGLVTRWLTETDTQRIPNPIQNEEQTARYVEGDWFDLQARAGYISGLGARSVVHLPPIDTSGQTWEIRSNAQVVSRMVKHVRAESLDGDDLSIDLLLFAEGQLGYGLFGEEAAPYAFERILDAGISLEVNVYRESGAVSQVWAGGANLVRSEDVDIEFTSYGQLRPEHWNVYENTIMGRTAELMLPEQFEEVFSVSDGEVFAVEYVVKLSTRNYEYPNWRSYAEFYDSFNFKLSVNKGRGSMDNQLQSTLQEIDSGSVPITKIPAKSYAMSLIYAGAAPSAKVITRPPWIFPTYGQSYSYFDQTTRADVRSAVRDRASFNPFGGGGNLGAQAAISVDHKAGGAEYEAITRDMLAKPSYLSFFIPVYDENDPPESIDVDFNLALEGTLEFRATDATGFQALANGGFSDPSQVQFRAKGFIYTPANTYSLDIDQIKYSGKELPELDEVLAEDIRYVRIPEDEGQPQEGLRVEVELNSQQWDEDHPLYSKINDIVTIAPGDWVAIWFQLETNTRLNGSQVEYIKTLDANFINSLKPSLTSDTPGVRFVPSGPDGPLNEQVIESTLLPAQSAAYFDPDRNGEGLFVELLEGGVAVVYMFTYDPQTGQQAWLLGVGKQLGDSIIVEELLRPTGPAFGPGYNIDDLVYNDFGTLSFQMPTCGTSASPGNLYIEPGNETGFEWFSNFNYKQLSVIANCDGGETSANGPLSGSWFDPTHDGEGIILQALENGLAVVQWFTYDTNGEQFWIQGTGTFDGDTLVVEDLFTTSGTGWGSAFIVEDVEPTPWGSLSMTFSGCGQAAVSYQSLLPEFGSGTLNMQRLTNLMGIECTD